MLHLIDSKTATQVFEDAIKLCQQVVDQLDVDSFTVTVDRKKNQVIVACVKNGRPFSYQKPIEKSA